MTTNTAACGCVLSDVWADPPMVDCHEATVILDNLMRKQRDAGQEWINHMAAARKSLRHPSIDTN